MTEAGIWIKYSDLQKALKVVLDQCDIDYATYFLALLDEELEKLLPKATVEDLAPTKFLFDIDDLVEYDGASQIVRGPIVGRQVFNSENYYYVGLGNPWLTEILIKEDKLRNV